MKTHGAICFFGHIYLLLTFSALLCIANSSFAQQINEVRRTDSDRAIIFIHGFHGSAADTFTNFETGQPWWNLMNADNTVLSPGHPLSAYDIYTVDYTADFKTCTSLEDMAKHVRDVIENAKIYERYNHVWFVAHSMGGLIVKRVLSDYNRPAMKRLLSRIAGVIFLGVPSQGSSVAEQGTKLLRLLVPFTTEYECSVRDLLPTNANTTIQIIETDWKRLIEDREKTNLLLPRTYCAFEKYKTCLSRLHWLLKWMPVGQVCVEVVPRLYTASYCDGDVPQINADHIDIVKPRDQEDFLYTWARGRIEASARAADGHRIKSWPVVQGGGRAELLGGLIERLGQRHRQINLYTGLPEVDEEIVIEDESVLHIIRRFQTKPGVVFRGATWADVFHEIDSHHSCINVEITRNRRTVVVRLDSEQIAEATAKDGIIFTCKEHG